jgi:hypothetical protein
MQWIRKETSSFLRPPCLFPSSFSTTAAVAARTRSDNGTTAPNRLGSMLTLRAPCGERGEVIRYMVFCPRHFHLSMIEPHRVFSVNNVDEPAQNSVLHFTPLRENPEWSASANPLVNALASMLWQGHPRQCDLCASAVISSKV